MKQNLLLTAAEFVTSGARHGSPSMIRRRFRQERGVEMTFETASAILVQLQGAGVVGPLDLWKHSHPVLLHPDEIQAAVEAWQKIGDPESNTLYECPQCCRVAPWTDGRGVKHGDLLDEYWCQHCGVEVPVSACAKTVLLAA
jgi:predicted RNA-binding Zn-ribbon protein involved in translation (DUF1610 family)